MNATSSLSLLFSTSSSFSMRLLAVFVLSLGIAVGVFLIKWGWANLKRFDMSGRIGGFYYARTPYRGYNRWRSQKWNMEHTM